MANNSTQLIKNIQEVLCILDNDFESVKPLLDQIITEIIKNPKHTNAFISYINNKLSNSISRKNGLILLQEFLPFCNNDILEQEAILWLNNSLKTCKNELYFQEDAYKVIKSLLEICHNSPDLNKSITSGTLNKIIENVTKIDCNSEDSISAIKCFETCLRVYPGSCTTFKSTIENFILSFIDCSIPTTVRAAGKCFNALQQIGGGGTKGINHKQSWKNQQLNLCSTIHSLMDEFFESVMEMDHVQEENETPIPLKKIPDGDKNKINFQRIINLVTFLQEMLLGAFPVAKSVCPNTILNLISRGLAITKSTLNENILNEMLNLSSALYVIHKNLLQLLQCLIICLEGNLIPYSTVICKLLINNLKLTKPKDAGNVKAFCDLRVTAYQTISLWITTTKSASCITTFSDSFIATIISDITPYTTEINLTVQKLATKQTSKKAKKKMQQEIITQSGIAKNYSPIVKKTITSDNFYQNKICSVALNVLHTTLIMCGPILKPLIHKQLQEFVVKTLFTIHRGISPIPYNNINCKIGLYKVLTVLVTNHNSNLPPPVGYAIHLLSKGQSDENPDIAMFCSVAISNINSLIHPVCATMQFPIDVNNLRHELEEKENGEVEILETMEELAENNQDIVENLEKNVNNEDLDKSFELEEKENGEVEILETMEELVENLEKNVNNEDLDKSFDTSSDNISSPNKNHFEISDEEIMEKLTYEEEWDTKTEVIEIEDKNAKCGEEINDIINLKENISISQKENEEVINLVEEDMFSSFVDIVNE